MRRLILAALVALAALHPAPARAGTINLSPIEHDFREGRVYVQRSTVGTFLNRAPGPTRLERITFGDGCGDFTIDVEKTLPTTLQEHDFLRVNAFYTPSNVGADRCVVTFEHDGGGPRTMTLVGSGSESLFSVSPSPIDFSDVPALPRRDGQKQVVVRLRDDGPYYITIARIEIVGSEDFTFAAPSSCNGLRDCPVNLLLMPENREKQIALRCAPGDVGARTARIRITHDADQRNPFEVDLRCNGVAPTVLDREEPVGDTLDLGHARVGQRTATGTVRIRNVTAGRIHINGTTRENDPGAEFRIMTGPTGDVDLDAGEAATWTLDCKPGDLGERRAVLAIDNEAMATPLRIPLLCTGDGARLSAPTPLNLGKVAVGNTGRRVLTVTNVGNLPTRITGAEATVKRFRVENPFPIDIAARGTVDLEVSFTPLDGTVQDAVLSIFHEGLGSSISVLVHGDGVAPGEPVLTARTDDGTPDDGALDLGAADVRGPPQRRTITLRNDSGAVLEAETCTVEGAAFTLAADTPCPLTVQPHTEARLAIVFAPPAEAGHAGRLELTGDSGALTISLAGIGLDRHLSITDTVVVFPDTVRNPDEPALARLTVTNTLAPGATAGAPLHVSQIAVTGESFTLVGPTAVDIAPGASADLTVAFTPPRAADFTGALTFAADDTRAPSLSIELRGRGLDVGPDGPTPPRSDDDDLGTYYACDAGSGTAGAAVALLALSMRRRRRRATSA